VDLVRIPLFGSWAHADVPVMDYIKFVDYSGLFFKNVFDLLAVESLTSQCNIQHAAASMRQAIIKQIQKCQNRMHQLHQLHQLHQTGPNLCDKVVSGQ